MTEQTKAPRTILSTAEKIAKLEEQLAALRVKRAEEVSAENAAAALAGVTTGYSVSFELGKGDTKRELFGVVLGRGLNGEVDSVKVQVGDGFDTSVYSIPVAKLTRAAAPVADEEPVSEADPLAEPQSDADALLDTVQLS